jgi:hypothetical protein
LFDVVHCLASRSAGIANLNPNALFFSPPPDLRALKKIDARIEELNETRNPLNDEYSTDHASELVKLQQQKQQLVAAYSSGSSHKSSVSSPRPTSSSPLPSTSVLLSSSLSSSTSPSPPLSSLSSPSPQAGDNYDSENKASEGKPSFVKASEIKPRKRNKKAFSLVEYYSQQLPKSIEEAKKVYLQTKKPIHHARLFIVSIFKHYSGKETL